MPASERNVAKLDEQLFEGKIVKLKPQMIAPNSQVTELSETSKLRTSNIIKREMSKTSSQEEHQQDTNNNKRPLQIIKTSSMNKKPNEIREPRSSSSFSESSSSMSSRSPSLSSSKFAPQKSIQSNSSSTADNGSKHETLNENIGRYPGADISDTDAAAGSLSSRSNLDYDRIRNQTLMFFLDKLVAENSEEGKSLHDLSCLFGSREFTREMRQIVGASRNGLGKFLQSFPSLFTVDGERVHLTSLNQLNESSDKRARDYTREAVEYFTSKLAQFGRSQVPLRYLFGYRSQASQEVRHVSGRNTREFRQFLAEHPNHFELIGEDEVISKSINKQVNDEIQQQPNSLVSLETRLAESNVVMDPYLNRQLAQSIASHMFELDLSESPLDELHQIMLSQNKSKSTNQLYTSQIGCIDDLAMLIRMHPRLFQRTGDKVKLLSQTLLSNDNSQQLNNSNQRRSSLDPSLSSTPTSLVGPTTKYISPKQATSATSANSVASNPANDTDASTITTNTIPKSNSNSAHSINSSSPKINDNNMTQTSKTNPRSTLRADAPVFVPAHLQNDTKNGKHQPLRRSVTNLGTNYGQAKQQLAREARQSLRSYLIKASASNQANYSQSKLANVQHVIANRQLSNQIPSKNNQLIANPSSNADHNQRKSTDQLRARWINIVREASNIVARIMSCTDAVALDCKGFNLGINGEISIVQIAFLAEPIQLPGQNEGEIDVNISKKPEVCLFDLKTNTELAYLLKPLLESEKIVKIVHDVRNKSNALYNQFKIMLNNVFDTQVANLVIQQQETARPAYKSRYISINKLCEIYGTESLNKYRKLIKSRTRHGTNGNNIISGLSNNTNAKSELNYWLARPLTEAMIYELTMDVYCLIGGVYQKLKNTIRSEYEPLIDQLNRECVLARIKPDEIRGVKKERKIDLEVIELKRKLYSDNGGALLVLSNREIRLLRHIDLTEQVRAKIGHCKKVAKKLERLDMKAAKTIQAGAEMSSEHSEISSISHEPYSTLNLDTNDQATEEDKPSSLESRQPDMDGLSTMMDELKDKMIGDTCSLLGSIVDDDLGFDAELEAARNYIIANHNDHHHHHHHHEHEHEHDRPGQQVASGNSSCNCSCHRSESSTHSSGRSDSPASSNKSLPPSLEITQKEKDLSSVKSIATQNS